jgi:hypothetical protein
MKSIRNEINPIRLKEAIEPKIAYIDLTIDNLWDCLHISTRHGATIRSRIGKYEINKG